MRVECKKSIAMRRKIVIATTLLCLVACWFLWVNLWYYSIKPLPTLAQHLASRPEPIKQLLVTKSGKDYLYLCGPVDILPRFPSGGPIYIFNEQGKLEDWTPDSGDDDAFHLRWNDITAKSPATTSEVKAWAERQ